MRRADAHQHCDADLRPRTLRALCHWELATQALGCIWSLASYILGYNCSMLGQVSTSAVSQRHCPPSRSFTSRGCLVAPGNYQSKMELLGCLVYFLFSVF